MELQRTVAEIASLVQGRVSGPSEQVVAHLRSPAEAGRADLAAFFRAGAGRVLGECRAGALLVPETLEVPDLRGRAVIRVADAELALDTITGTWGPELPGPAPGVHPSAVIEEGAVLGDDVAVGPWVFVGAGARIGKGSRLWPRVYVGAGAVVGDDARLHPGAYVGARCVLGARVILRPGAVVGSEGFGFRRDAAGRHVRSPQVGTVELGDDVEVGSNTSIDRARLETTRIGEGTKLDALTQVGHNSTIGAHSVVVAHCAFAGGSHVGRHAMISGMVGLTGKARVADGTLIGPFTLVDGETRGGGEAVAGVPAVPITQWKRQVLSLRRLPELIATVRDLALRKDDRGA